MSTPNSALRILALILLSAIFPLSLLAQTQPSPTQSTTSPQQLDTTHLKTYHAPEIVVTGFPNIEGKTPAAFETVTRAEIKQVLTEQDIPTLLSAMPSATSYSQSGTDVGYSFLSIRGFDSRRISVMVNGIPQNDPEDHTVYWIDMPDLASATSTVHIQRGAGTAFYGPPSIGGSINVETLLSGKREITLSSGYGSYNTRKYAAQFNSGIFDDKYIISARLSKTHTDGYRNSDWVDLSSYAVSVARFDSNFSLQANFYGGPITDGLNYYGLHPSADRHELTDPELRKVNWSESGTYERRPEEHEEFFQPHYEVLTNWELSESASLSNSVFYIQGDGQFDYDGVYSGAFAVPALSNAEFYRLTKPYADRYGFTPLPVSDSLIGNELARAYVGNQQWGWLPRFEWLNEMGTFTAGAELRFNRSIHWSKLLSAAHLPADLPGDYHYTEYHGGKDVLSGYISQETSYGKDVHLLASIQLVSQKYHFYDQKPFYVDSSMARTRQLDTGWTSYEYSIPFIFLNPRLGVNITFAENMTSFASLSLTSREPRFADYYQADFFSEPNFARAASGHGYDFTSPNVRPERLLDLELGWRLLHTPMTARTSVSASVTGYYMSFTDELIATGNTDGFGAPITGNAEKTLHYGLELGVECSASEVLTLGANATFSKNEIKQFTTFAGLPGAAEGKVPIGFPSTTANVVVGVTPIENFFVSLTGRYVGSFYGDILNTPEFQNDPYFVLDANVRYRIVKVAGLEFIDLKLEANNLLDKLYTSYVTSSAGFFVAAPRHGFASIEIGL
ncbi:MAG: TonB-dependent receptor plug domain-containing protein [Candidatus Kapaibacterium sp.]